MVPVVAATRISRIVCVAVFLFLLHEVPLFVELDLLGVRGKTRPARHGVFRNALRQVACNGLPYRDRLSPSGPFFAFRFLHRHIRGWRRRFRPAGGRQTKSCRAARKTFPCKLGNTAIASTCSFRTTRGCECFFTLNAVFGAVFILATKLVEIVHDRFLVFQMPFLQTLTHGNGS